VYFIPGNNGKSTPPKKKKNSKRPLIIWVAVFLGILILTTRVFHYFNNQAGNEVIHDNRFGPQEEIDPKILIKRDFGLPQINKGDEIIRHFAYTLSFSKKDEEVYWVAYILKRSYLSGVEPRTNEFEADPDVPNGSAQLEDYRNSGYDKGHLAPAADMKWSKIAMKESFLLSNVCPQDHKFNDGIWADLEKAIRKWVQKDEIDFVVTGPVLPDSNNIKIGKDQVTVPSYFYKVIFSPNPYPKAIGFIIPNKPGKQSFLKYACSVSQVENATHLTFFPMIPWKISHQIKNQFDLADWRSTPKFKDNKHY